MTPPPLPSPIRHLIFFGKFQGSFRLSGPKLFQERLHDAHRQAEEWMNANPSIEIVDITNGFFSDDTTNAVTLTVWYRERVAAG